MVIDDEFADYVSARWASLVRAAMLLGCSHQDAEDLVQSTLLRVYAAWKRVRRARNPDAYVYRTMINCLSSRHRKKRVVEISTPVLPETSQTSATRDFDVVTVVDKALESLSARQREVVVLRFYADLTEQETSEVLGIPLGTVKSRCSRALKVMANSENLQHLMESE